ncbi:glycine-rich protein (plasmid) [Bacillus thuringiensis]|uniref:glycine-rich protein n=1 Tax=Bacillus thuringiensis TaxID=1428 RepID=UPI00222575AD|nr:glycine-rich protein [Bacillus thuringiensis]UYX56200.1 glycine-rich protein [Bacillus thuringiensis]
MATYTVNQPGSPVATFPASLKRGDVMNINNTSVGRSGTILKWTVPNDGIYRLVAMGAQGGAINNDGGKGALMAGDFSLLKGQIINILVGQQGIPGNTGGAIEGGGGGGTFIVRGNENFPLLVAAGGGGDTNYATIDLYGMPGETTRLASVVTGSSGSRGEGQGGYAGSGTGAGAGGGFFSDGYGTSYGAGGYSYKSGGTGGASNHPCHGGFGGGGAGGFSGGGGGGGYTGGTGGGNGAAYTSGGGGSYNTGENQNNIRGSQSGNGKVQILFIGSANEPPTKPLLIKQPISNSMNLSNEAVLLEWIASTDPEGNAITYEIDFYNGSTWASVAKNITDTNYDCILPSVTTDKAQLRIRATDSENGASEYVLSNVFSVAQQLYVIKDGDINKSYKNGNWESI